MSTTTAVHELTTTFCDCEGGTSVIECIKGDSGNKIDKQGKTWLRLVIYGTGSLSGSCRSLGTQATLTESGPSGDSNSSASLLRMNSTGGCRLRCDGRAPAAIRRKALQGSRCDGMGCGKRSSTRVLVGARGFYLLVFSQWMIGMPADMFCDGPAEFKNGRPCSELKDLTPRLGQPGRPGQARSTN